MLHLQMKTKLKLILVTLFMLQSTGHAYAGDSYPLTVSFPSGAGISTCQMDPLTGLLMNKCNQYMLPSKINASSLSYASNSNHVYLFDFESKSLLNLSLKNQFASPAIDPASVITTPMNFLPQSYRSSSISANDKFLYINNVMPQGYFVCSLDLFGTVQANCIEGQLSSFVVNNIFPGNRNNNAFFTEFGFDGVSFWTKLHECSIEKNGVLSDCKAGSLIVTGIASGLAYDDDAGIAYLATYPNDGKNSIARIYACSSGQCEEIYRIPLPVSGLPPKISVAHGFAYVTFGSDTYSCQINSFDGSFLSCHKYNNFSADVILFSTVNTFHFLLGLPNDHAADICVRDGLSNLQKCFSGQKPKISMQLPYTDAGNFVLFHLIDKSKSINCPVKITPKGISSPCVQLGIDNKININIPASF